MADYRAKLRIGQTAHHKLEKFAQLPKFKDYNLPENNKKLLMMKLRRG